MFTGPEEYNLDSDLIAEDEDSILFEDNAVFSEDFDFDIEDLSSGEDENEDVDEVESRLTLEEELLIFFIGSNVSVIWMKFLLRILKGRCEGVPTFYALQKKRLENMKSKEKKCEGGDICLFSVFDVLKDVTSRGFLPVVENVIHFSLKVNIDSMPLYRNSPLTLTPILISFRNINLNQIFPVGFFLGIVKPDIELFLSDFIQEIVQLCNGKLIDSTFYYLTDIVFVCDAPARAFLQSINYHGHRDGCGYCRATGIYIEDRQTYSHKVGELRTDEQYRHGQESNQKSLSPLLQIPLLKLRTSFPPEYQHLVCLGVCRRLFSFYFTKVKGFSLPCRLSKNQLSEIGKTVANIEKFIPGEFQRHLRKPSEFHFYKATQLRSLLLYFGPFLLRKHLKKEYYEHFLLLHTSIYIFCSNCNSHMHETAVNSLKTFVKKTKELFSRKCMSYNFHVLLHLPEFHSLYGPLDGWSTFLFESYLSTIKRRVKRTPHIFHHVRNVLCVLHGDFDKSMKRNLHYSASPPDNVCSYESGVLMIDSLHSDGSVSGKKMNFKKDLYDYPHPSSYLGIGFYVLSNTCVTNVIPINKHVCVPYKDSFLLMPFASTDYGN